MAVLAAMAVGSTILGGIASKNSYKIQKYQAQTNAKLAAMKGKETAMNLSMEFNKSMASDMVMAAAQGRRGGSVEAIASAAEKQYNWDVDYAKFSAKLQESGFTSQASQYGMAGKQSLLGSFVKAAGQAGNYMSQASAIGGSTKPKDSGTLYEGGASGWY